MEENKNIENEQENEDTNFIDTPEEETDVENIAPVEIEPQDEDSEEKFSLGREVFEWIQAIVVALVIALALRTFVFTLVKVEGASMEPTLHNLDRLIVTRLGYVPQDGDIIIFRPKYSPTTPYVKRVIATPGQTVDIDYSKGKVFVDGKELNEQYIKAPTHESGTTKFPATVPKGCVFAMGDNRNNSRDSRFIEVGMIAEDTIIGHAIYRVWPFSAFGQVQ